ncbi:hypothetical protein BH09BAC6_BH09BAC6_27980 [soil metagenome]|jgi:hypothetical protein
MLYLYIVMKRCLIVLVFSYTFINSVYGQSPSATIDSLIKFGVITTKERPLMEKEVRFSKDKGYTFYRIIILGELENILFQKIYHVNLHTAATFVSFRSEHVNKHFQDSINMVLRTLLEKINKANLLSDRVYAFAKKNIDSSQYVAEPQMVAVLTEMSSRLEWLSPKRLLPVADELHRNGIVSDSSFVRLNSDINRGKIESAFQLINYCRYARILDMAKYPDDPEVWLGQMHHDIASILPGLDFTDFGYTGVPDTSFSIPGVRFKVSLTSNGQTYKYKSIAISKFKKGQDKITPKEIFVEDFYRIFNKVLTDQQSPFRLHSIMFDHGAADNDRHHMPLIALNDAQVEIFMKEPCRSYMLVSLDDYDQTLTSAKIDSLIAGWKTMGLFEHLSNTEVSKAVDDVKAADRLSTGNLLSNFPDVTYSLRDAIMGPRRLYSNLLAHLAKITHGAFKPTKIVEIKEKKGVKLQYLSKGKIHSFTFPKAYGWSDAKFAAFLNALGRENTLPGNFYQFMYDDKFIYLTKQQYRYAEKNKLLNLSPVK